MLLGDKEFKDNFKIILMTVNLNSRPPGIVKEDCMLVLTVCMEFSRWRVKYEIWFYTGDVNFLEIDFTVTVLH